MKDIKSDNKSKTKNDADIVRTNDNNHEKGENVEKRTNESEIMSKCTDLRRKSTGNKKTVSWRDVCFGKNSFQCSLINLIL